MSEKVELSDYFLSEVRYVLGVSDSLVTHGERLLGPDEVVAAIRELRDTAAETVLFHEQDYGFCLDPKCRCCAALKKLKALLPEKADERTAPDS